MLKVKTGDLDKMGLLFERYHRALLAFFTTQRGSRLTAKIWFKRFFIECSNIAIRL